MNGVARMRGRIGFPSDGQYPTVPADGEWKPITDLMDGCQALEIVAGVGGEKFKGRYALLHAIALNAYNPRNRILNWLLGRRKIRCQNAVYGSLADRIRLKWDTPTGDDLIELQRDQGGEAEGRKDGGKKKIKTYNRPYRLMLKTQSNFGKDKKTGHQYSVRYYITRLWFDHDMKGSRGDDNRDDGVV